MESFFVEIFIFSFGPETILNAPVEYNHLYIWDFWPQNPQIQFILDWLTKAEISPISANLPSDDFCQKEMRGKLVVGGVLYCFLMQKFSRRFAPEIKGRVVS